MKSIKLLSLILVFTFAFSTVAFADDPIDIGSDAIEKDDKNFVKTMYYEPRDRVNNIIFIDKDKKYRLSSVKDYIVEYKDNCLPGTATVTYTGVGNYTGTYSANFTILKASIATITTKASFDKNGKLTVSANSGSEDLVYGKDYYCTPKTDVYGNVTVKFFGIGTKYTGTATETIKAKKNPNPPAISYLDDVIVTRCKNIKHKKIYLKWIKVKNIAGYQIKYHKKGSSSKKLTVSSKTKKYTINKLKKKKKYYVKMRCFIVYDNKKYYGDWTDVYTVKIKK